MKVNPAHPVTCLDCGELGAETDDDPAPGLCPKCFESRMEIADRRFRESDRSIIAAAFFLREAGVAEGAVAAFARAMRHAAELDRRTREWKGERT